MKKMTFTYLIAKFLSTQRNFLAALLMAMIFFGVNMASAQVVINEFVFNHSGTDDREFIEVFGDPKTDYSHLTLVVIDGDGGNAGNITKVIPVGTTDDYGIWVAYFVNELMNGSQTLLLVEGFSGSEGDDLDTNNDGTPESTPWTSIIDEIAVYDGGSSDYVYAGVVLERGYDGVSFTVGGASRIPNGIDTDTPNDWKRNDFDLAGYPSETGTITGNEAYNSSGGLNYAPLPLFISEIMYNPASSEDDWEWVELYNNTDQTIDLAGYVIDDNNTVAHAGANIPAGIIPPFSAAILYNADDVTAADFEAAWGCGINLIPVYDWSNLALNNGGDVIGLWRSFADYDGNHLSHANAFLSLPFDDGAPFPADNNSASIYLTDLVADGFDGANWALSTDGGATPAGDGYTSMAAGGNSGNDVGSPGGLFLTPTPITTIQTPTDINLTDVSPEVGNTVLIQGVVTGYFEETGSSPEPNKYMSIQHGTGPYSGIFAYHTNGSFDPDEFPVGTSVSVKGVVAELFGTTVIEITLPSAQIRSLGSEPVPAPADLNTGDLPLDGAEAEQWEGVFIQFTCATVTMENNQFNEFTINDGTGTAKVDDLGGIDVMPDDGDVLSFIRGIGFFSFGEYKLLPRNDNDFKNDNLSAAPAAKAFADAGSLELDGAEIIAFDAATQQLFVTSGDGLQIVDYADPTNPSLVTILKPTDNGAADDEVTHVNVANGIVAISVIGDSDQDPGQVQFYDTDGNFLNAVTVGALPDMLTFTPNGLKVLVANEGEADGANDPEGSISIIDISGGVGSASVSTADFSSFNGTEDALRASGVRIFPGKTVSEDVEPEYIAVSPDGSTAYAALQEANAIAVINIATATVTAIKALGRKDHSASGNGLDASDRDDAINIQNWPVLGMYMPDAIAAFEVNGETYLVTANEGDARDEDERIKDLTLDPTVFPDAAMLQLDENIGRLQASTIDGDIDNDGDFDELHVYGARSFTIWDGDCNVVFDSGDDFEQIIALQLPELFNSQGDPGSFDGRSDNKGPEPEALTIATVNGKLCAFIGLERVGGYMVYEITDPSNPVFLNYVPGGANVGPEDIEFIGGDEDLDKPLVVTANEESNSLAFAFSDVKNECAAEMVLCGNPSGGSGVFVAHSWTVLSATSEGFRLGATDQPTLTVDISGATPGVITFQYTVEDECGSLASGQASITVFQPEGIACNDEVNVTVDEDCGAQLLPDNVLEGLSNATCGDRFYVKVLYPNAGQTINFVRECGLFKYVVYRINGEPDWDDDGATTDEYPDLEICWGYVNAEDKTPPAGCIRKVVALLKEPVAKEDADYFLTKEEPKLINGNYYDYAPVTNDSEACGENSDMILPAFNLNDDNVNLLICTDIDSIYNVEDSWTEKRYAYYTGFPYLTDNCTDVDLLRVTDELEDLECEYEGLYINGELRYISKRIIRTFYYADEKGNESTTTQEICFFKPVIKLPNCKEHLDVCWYGGTDQNNTEEELAPAIIESAPYYINGACMKMYLDDHTCNIVASYEDLVLDGPEGCGFKVIRTWTLLDWCWDPLKYDNPDLTLIENEYTDCPEPTYSDWFNKSLTYEQHLIIGDQTVPVVTCPKQDVDWDGDYDAFVFSVDPFDCEASIKVPEPTIEDKNECNYSYTVEIWTDSPVLWHGIPTGETELVKFSGAAIDASSTPIMVSGVPKGKHYFKYIVDDLCGNVGESDLCPFYVIDEIEPVAVCDDQLNVSVGSGSGADSGYGYSRVYAYDIDEGSWDNCSPVALVTRRFVVEESIETFEAATGMDLPSTIITLDKPESSLHDSRGVFTPWIEYVEFICEDTHQEVLIELGVFDDANMDGKYDFNEVAPFPGAPFKQKDNFNKCWMEILVEDKIDPICQAPHDITVKCDEVPYFATLPQDRTTTWSELTDVEKDNIVRWFGELQVANNTFPKAWDNCYAEVEMIDVIFDIHCGAGTITRVFQAYEVKPDGTRGKTSTNTCRQVITLTRHHDYCIKFPKDIEAQCKEMPDSTGVEFTEYGCDLLAVSIQDERFDVPGSADECYKVFRTYRVINWCQFEEDVDPFTPLFDRVDTEFDIEPMVIGRDEDGDGRAGDEDVYVRFIGWDTDLDESFYNGGAAGTTYVDRNCDPFDNNPRANENPFGNPKGHWRNTEYSRGFYQYTQVIKVYDDLAPVVVAVGEERFASYANPGLGEDKADVCVGGVSRMVEVTEECTPDAVDIKLVILFPFNDESNGVTLYDRGVTAIGTEFGFSIDGPENTGEFTRKFTLNGTFPQGAHTFEVHVSDGCGNVDGNFVPFEIYDAKAPAPICLSGLTVELMPVDANGDGNPDPEEGMATLWASDFIASDIWDCSEPITYSIHRADLVDKGDVVASPDVTNLTLTCDDGTVARVYIYGWDAVGNSDRCEALVTINDFMDICNTSQGVSIAGLIMTEDDRALADVNVELSGQLSNSATTGNTGNYTFEDLILGNDYTITPLKDVNHKNGVSTFDLVLISKHILGINPLGSPYKLIAADVNNSSSVTTLDLIQLRKLILSINTEFTNNTSWRFIDASFEFEDVTNPWLTQFPEVRNINDLPSAILDADFIAVKIGDVNNSASVNNIELAPRSMVGDFNFQVEGIQMVAGHTYHVDFDVADLTAIQGYQFTLSMSNDIEFVDMTYGIAHEENFGFIDLDHGHITTSWNQGEASVSQGTLFTLVVRAHKDVSLSEVLNISSRWTEAEAYNKDGELMNVGIDFGATVKSSNVFALYQNVPNPFKDETIIGFTLPEATKATLSVADVTGRVLKTITADYDKGYNQVRFSRNELPAVGVLNYTLKTKNFVSTKQMVITE